MAKLPIDMNEFNANLDLSNIQIVEKDAGILARQFAPVPVSYTGSSFLSVNGGTGFRTFSEGKEEDVKNKKRRGDASAQLRTLPCVTLTDIIVVDRKLFKIYNDNLEYDVTSEVGNAQAIEAWRQSENYTALTQAIKAAILQNASRVIDSLGFYGVDSYGQTVPQITPATATAKTATDPSATIALDTVAELVGNPSAGASSATFSSALRKEQATQNSNANRITFGAFDYGGIGVLNGDTVEQGDAFTYSAGAFKWGVAGVVDADILREATLDDGTILALSNQYGLRVDLYVGALWNLDRVGYASLGSKEAKTTK